MSIFASIFTDISQLLSNSMDSFLKIELYPLSNIHIGINFALFRNVRCAKNFRIVHVLMLHVDKNFANTYDQVRRYIAL